VWPELTAAGDARATLTHPFVGPMELLAADGPDGAAPATLCCENEPNIARLFGGEAATPFPKDGINDHVVSNAATVNPAARGTKCAFWYKLTLAGGTSARVRLRAARAACTDPFGNEYAAVVAQRRAEADEFYAELTPSAASADEAMVMRQGFAGMLWCKQREYFDGDDGTGLGALHQTGWTGLVADIIRRRHGAVPTLGAVLAPVFEQA
jgi:hypothetical protein